MVKELTVPTCLQMFTMDVQSNKSNTQKRLMFDIQDNKSVKI